MNNDTPAKKIVNWLAPVLTLALLGGIVIFDKLRVDPGEAGPFLKRTGDAILAMPKRSGNWYVQREHELDPEAIKLLDVNAYLQRTYVNSRTGETVEMLLVQCRDTRMMLGHYPPNCYPSSGCQIQTLKVGTDPLQHWAIRGGPTVPGIEYEVTRPNGAKFIVRDFFVLPNGKFAVDMDSVAAAAKSYQELVYGGAQMQVLFDPKTTTAHRDMIFSDLMAPFADLLQSLRSAQCKQAAIGGSPSMAANQPFVLPVGAGLID